MCKHKNFMETSASFTDILCLYRRSDLVDIAEIDHP